MSKQKETTKKGTVKQLTPKVTKLDQKDLETIQQFLGKLQELRGHISEAAIQQQTGLAAFAETHASFQKFQGEIEFKYGKIQIDVSTGAYTEVQDEPKEMQEDGADTKD
mgnify:FL=1|tara:strand:- start:43267 stop:43593 length:327 start_codon:yes stop_codon:yes gene_type:complete